MSEGQTPIKQENSKNKRPQTEWDSHDDKAPILLWVSSEGEEMEANEPENFDALLSIIPDGCRGDTLILPSQRMMVSFYTKDKRRPHDPPCPEPRSATILIIDYQRVTISIKNHDSFVNSVRAALREAKANAEMEELSIVAKKPCNW